MALNPWFALLMAPLLVPGQLPFLNQSEPSSEQKITMYSKPAVVRVLTGCTGEYYDSRTGQYIPFNYNPAGLMLERGMITAGSGYFISPDGYLVTNTHLVENAAGSDEQCRQHLERNLRGKLISEGNSEAKVNELLSNRVIWLDESTFFNRQHVILPNVEDYQKGEIFQFEVKEKGTSANQGSKDVAVIKIEVRNAPVLKLVDSNQIQVQDAVTAIGYPGAADAGFLSYESAAEATITTGIISNPHKTLQDGSPIIQVDIRTAPGSSGSPVLNQAGEVIGMITLRWEDEEGSSIPFAIPSNTIQEFVRKSGAINQEGPTDKLYREGLSLYWQKDFEGARTKFQAVKSLFPHHSEADRLLRESDQAIAEAWENKNYTGWLAIIGAAAAVLGLAYWWVRRQSATPEMAEETLTLGDRENGEEQETRGPETPASNLPRLITNLFPSKPLKTMMSSEPLVELKNAEGQIRRIYLQSERYRLGRDRTWSDLEIPDEGWEVISRHHALFVKEGNDYRIYDGDGTQASTNGTFINGQLIGQEGYLLRDGDQLTIGQDERNQVILTYLHPTPRRSVPSPAQARQ